MTIVSQFLDRVQNLIPIIAAIRAAGGTAYLVGGSVRDLVLGREVKDFDIEVHAMQLDELEKCLRKFGPVSLVGKQFGVLRLHVVDVDWSLPRKDSLGRKPVVNVDPSMNIQDACRRRDVTMNAMAIDLGFVCDNFEQLKTAGAEKNIDCAKAFKIIDPYGGLEDIKQKKMRAVDATLFTQDPLRFYRVMQFISRFEIMPDAELNQICKTMDVRDTRHGGLLARERISEEIKKLLLKSRRPSLGFRWLKDLGRLDELFPELGALVGVMHRAAYHPEGDVFEHTMQGIDAAAVMHEHAMIAPQNDEERIMVLFGILCHDLGKPKTVDEFGSCKGHDIAGVPICRKFLKRFTRENWLIDAVAKIVRYHSAPGIFPKEGAHHRAYKRLALSLAPQVTPMLLVMVSWCDLHSRNAKKGEPIVGRIKEDSVIEEFLNTVKSINIEFGPEPPVLLGRDLLDVIVPGPVLGEKLKKAYQIQIDEGIQDKEELKKRVLGD